MSSILSGKIKTCRLHLVNQHEIINIVFNLIWKSVPIFINVVLNFPIMLLSKYNRLN